MSFKTSHIEQILQGRDSGRVLDELLEDLPAAPEVAKDLQAELRSRGLTCSVYASKRESGVVYVMLNEHSAVVDAVVEVFERAYEPHLQFLVDVSR